MVWIEQWAGTRHCEANSVSWNTRDRQKSRNPTRPARDGGQGGNANCGTNAGLHVQDEYTLREWT